MSASTSRRLRFAAALLSTIACLAGFSPPAQAVRLTGSVNITSTDGGSAQVWFNCDGENPCRGTYIAVLRTGTCSDEFGRVDDFTITGLDLSRPGPISGSVTLADIDNQNVLRNPDGSCQFLPGPYTAFSTTFTGTFDGSKANLVFPTTGGLSFTGSATVVSRLARVTGTMSGSGSGGVWIQGNFSCEGENPCTGTATITQREAGCSNTYSLTDRFGIMGMNLAQAGPFSGGFIMRRAGWNTQRNPDGTCTFTTGPERDGGAGITGSWSGSSGTFSLPIDDYTATASFTASFTTLPTTTRPPVFEMTVTSSITPTVSSATASIQYRPTDVGRTGSVYTFAVAPRNRVTLTGSEAPLVVGKAGPAKATADEPVACVLAQLNGAGQLQGVSASGLQAYVSGVLSAQGQAVQVIDGVATANIAGATFYVGYGASATEMINGGINRSVVTVPGEAVCQPQPPQTGWWWNQAEDGRGFTLEVSGNTLVMVSYLYDEAGRAAWYLSAGPTSLDGSLFTGTLDYYTGGQTLTGAWRAPNRPPTSAGQVTLAFSDAHNGTLTWPGGTVAIKRFEFGVGGVNAVPLANQPESGWWWNAGEDGRAFFVEWQGGFVGVASYMYEADGHPVWYIGAAGTTNPRVIASNWEQYFNGQTLTGAYKPPTRPPTLVGPLNLQFTGPKDGVLTLPGGRQVAITRLLF